MMVMVVMVVMVMFGGRNKLHMAMLFVAMLIFFFQFECYMSNAVFF